jgi:hypothetical protein
LRRAALLASILAVIALTGSASGAGPRSPLDREPPKLTPVLAKLLSTPRWYRGDDARLHLAYEVQLTNTLAIPTEVRSLRVLDGNRRPVATLSGKRLEAAMSLIVPNHKVSAPAEADGKDPAAPPGPYRRAHVRDRRREGFTSLEVDSFGTARARSRASAARAVGSHSFARLVRIPDGRKLFLACRGSGGPTAVLISGFRGAYNDWTHVVPRPDAPPRPSPRSVLPQVARFTRVCGYDRPGTVDFGGTISPSTPVRQPTTAADDVRDLHALLASAHVPGPYVLVAHSWGGMSAYLFAQRYPQEVAGMVLLDAGSVFLKSALKPGQWKRFVRGGLTLGEPRTLEAVEYETSVAEILAASLDATFVGDTDSGHYIAGERPALVVGQIHRVVRIARTRSAPRGATAGSRGFTPRR